MRRDAEPVEVGDLSRASSGSGTRVRVLGEILGTMMLVLVVLALSESRHASAPAGWFFPLIVGTTVGMIILIEAPFSQASLNPTRDLGPRIMLLLMGFGSVAFPGPRGGLALLVTTIGPTSAACSACSSTTGWSEARRPSWQYALHQGGVDPSRAVHIGNRLDSDDRPAKGLGMRTIWLLRGEAPSTPSVEQLGEPDAVVTSLADAPAVIAGMAARAGATTGS